MRIPAMLSAALACVAASMNASLRAGEPPAASMAFINDDPAVKAALQLMDTGEFKEAEALLAPKDASDSGEALQARSELMEIIRRIRYDYSLDAAGLVDKVKESVPNATAEEVVAWADESRVRFKVIDGSKLYFRRASKNLFRFSEAAKQRLAAAGSDPGKSEGTLIQHLAAVIEEADRTGKVEVQPVRHHLTHTLTIPGGHPSLKAGSVVRVWLPYPQEYRQQRDVRLVSALPDPRLIAPNGVDGNPVSGGAQRTVYFEQTVTDPAEPLVFQEVVEYTSYAHYPQLDEALVRPLPPDWNGAYLSERPPHIVFTPEIRNEVAAIVGSETNSLAKALRIFRWVSANVPWNAEDEYCTIPSFAIRGFTARRGDCGIQSTVFVTMCRIAGIPARWQSGYETKPGDKWGMHDWAEIYIAPWGWLPADASYGVQDSSDPRIADFYCGHQDSYRCIVNLDWGRELFPPKHSLRSEPADFQRGEVEVDGKNLYFNEWTVVTEVVRTLLTESE